MALLEVRLEQERDIACRGAALRHLRLEHRQVLRAEALTPRRSRLFDERLRQSALAPHHPPVEQSEGDPQILSGHAENLRGPANRVIEVHALVPDRVPDGVGHGLDVSVPVVDEDDVEITVGAEPAAAVAAHGQQGQVPLVVAGRPVGQVREPSIGLGGIAPAEFLSPQARLLQEAPAPVAE